MRKYFGGVWTAVRDTLSWQYVKLDKGARGSPPPPMLYPETSLLNPVKHLILEYFK